MTSEDFALINLAETTREFVKPVEANDTEQSVYRKRNRKYDERSNKKYFFFRTPSLRLRENFTKFRNNLKRINCFKVEEDDEVVMMEDVPRHKSIDIGVGLARRMSLFLFTKKSVCLHPYHPFTPKQTTRKIHLWNDEK